MRKGNLLLLFFAIVMGTVAAYLARNWIEAHATVSPSCPPVRSWSRRRPWALARR